jgi:hypothetical protein
LDDGYERRNEAGGDSGADDTSKKSGSGGSGRTRTESIEIPDAVTTRTGECDECEKSHDTIGPPDG